MSVSFLSRIKGDDVTGFWSDVIKPMFQPPENGGRIRPEFEKPLDFPAVRENPPPPRLGNEELRQRALRLCDSQDPHEIAMGASSITDLSPDEREDAIRKVLRLPRKGGGAGEGRPVKLTRDKLRAMRRAQNYAVQNIPAVPGVEARFGLIKDLFNSVTASNQAILLLERLYNCLETKGDGEKSPWHYQDAFIEYLLTDETEHLARSNGEDSIVAGVMLLDRVHDDALRKKLLLHVMGSHPVRNCLMREVADHPDLLRKIEEMAGTEEVEIPAEWSLPCYARNEDRLAARAADIMNLPSDERHLAIHRLLASDDDPANTPEKISPVKVEKLERTFNYAIQNINNVPMDRRPDLIRHAFMNPVASRQALILCERLFKGLVDEEHIAPDRTPQHELMDFLLDESHLDRANGEDAILAGVLLLDRIFGEEHQRRYLEKVLSSTRIRDCLLRERNRHVGLMNGIANLAHDLQAEIPSGWQVLGA